METIQCSFGIVEMSTPPEVLWLMCISGKYNIMIDNCTNTDDDGNLICSGSIENGDAESYGSDDDTTPTTPPELRETSKHESPTTSNESMCESSPVVVTLGVTVGLLVALLGISTSSWMWTYLKLTRKKKPSGTHEESDR